MGGSFEILPDADQAVDCSPQAATRNSIHAVPEPQIPVDELDPRKVLFTAHDPREFVEPFILTALNGRVVGGTPLWIRFFRADRSKGLLAYLHCFASPAEMELSIVADQGMLTRSVLRVLAHWAFVNAGAVGLLRVVLRIPVRDHGLQDLARRAGFRHEGTARDFFGGGADASVWAMTADDCRWLSPRANPAIPAASSLPSNVQVH